ncbi:MAG: hypothetical protein C3F15_01210 [Holophagae bacterium]|nr:MAG: hypothetical protein C3F15_01210 [Holophagae bacterium]
MLDASIKALPVIHEIIAEAAAAPGAAAAATVDVRVGPYWTVVRSSVRAGLASTMAHADEHAGAPIRQPGSLHRLPPVALADLLRSTSPPEAAIGLAAVNALLDPVAAGAVDGNARELLCQRAQGRLLAVVGHFPFTELLRSACRELWVFERAGRLRPGDLEESSMDELLPHAEVVAVTGSAVLNHTVEAILSRMRPDAFKVMLGPSTPLASCLLERGFDVLCGTVVEDAEAVVRAVSEGAVTDQIPGVRRVCLWRLQV